MMHYIKGAAIGVGTLIAMLFILFSFVHTLHEVDRLFGQDKAVLTMLVVFVVIFGVAGAWIYPKPEDWEESSD